jgi:hypothetical protein
MNWTILVIILFLFIAINIYTQKEGFDERPEFRNKVIEINKCKNYNCVMNGFNSCNEICDKLNEVELQSKSAQDECKYRCMRTREYMMDNLRRHHLLFGRMPEEFE